MLNLFWRLAPIETGPWWHARHYVVDQMLKMDVQPGDIVCRLGNSYVYGHFWFSKFIANLTKSKYSHACMVMDVTDDDILFADVNTTGLRRQYAIDWVDDIRGEDILVLRYNSDPLIPKLAVENAKSVIQMDASNDLELLDNDDGRNFYCVELVCWCYLRAGAVLCEGVPIGKLPGWSKLYNVFAKVHGFDITRPVLCVGNENIGLLSSENLTEVGRISLPTKHRTKRKVLTFNGA